MATYAYPGTAALVPARNVLRQFHNNQSTTSPLSGFTQTASLPGSRWGWALEWAALSPRDRQALEGLLTRLSGQEHRLQLWDFKRPQPLGTINRTGVTASAAAQFATSITLNNCGSGTTLLSGDWFAVGGQLLMCVVDATANGSGVMTVEFRHMLRSAVAGGAAVTLNQPTALYILSGSTLDMPRQPGRAQTGLAADLIEVFA